MNNLTDVMQHWLQGQINDAVAGHTSRIAYLEDCNSALLRRLEKLEAGSPDFSGLSSHVEHMSELVGRLEKAYPDMVTTKDLQKDTRAESLMDKLQPLIEQIIRNELEGCVKCCDLEETVTEFLGYRKPINVDDKRDAQRYRWLREQPWYEGGVAVVQYSHKNVKTGTPGYSAGSLDALIDKELEK